MNKIISSTNDSISKISQKTCKDDISIKLHAKECFGMNQNFFFLL